MSSTLPESLDELFPQLATMTETDKVLKLARHMACDHCLDCQGWRPSFLLEFSQDTNCLCGHDADQHVDHKQDFIRRLKVALRIDELLEVIRKISVKKKKRLDLNYN
jgi:histone acetyltransferase